MEEEGKCENVFRYIYAGVTEMKILMAKQSRI